MTDIGFLYRKYKMNCITRPKLYNSDYEYQCDKNKALLSKVLLDPNADTIGVNVNNPEEWNIPDGQYNLLLDSLYIDKTQKVIKDTMNKRYKAKHPMIGKLTAGKRTKTRRRLTKGKKRGKNRKSRRLYKK
jgi:hypothetical protein